MNIRALVILVSGICCLKAADQKFVLPPDTGKLITGPGADLATVQCLLCHSSDYISTQPRLTATQWKNAVIKMKDKYGAPIDTNRVDALADYLVKNYGPRTK